MPQHANAVAGLRSGADADPVEDEKRAWLQALAGADADETLFQFETQLKALDRFFNLDNHPARRGGPIGMDHDLRAELAVADRRLRMLQRLGQTILRQSDLSKFVFRSYVETNLVRDADRDSMLERHLQQRTPLDSLYMLQLGLRSLAQISSGLLQTDALSVTTFRAFGHQYSALIMQNRYFNPLRTRAWSPVYDRIEHPLLLRAVRGAPSEDMRRALSLLILALNRYLKVVRNLRPVGADRDELLDALVTIAFLRSEFRNLLPWLEDSFPERAFPGGARHEAERQLLERVDAFAFQLALESRKVFQQLLLDFHAQSSVARLRAGLESAHGLLSAFMQQTIVLWVQTVLPDVQGRDLFADFVSRVEQSRRLREDLWIFHEVVAHVGTALADPAGDPLRRRVKYQVLVEFINYFENLALQLVRQADHEAFASFFETVRDLRNETFVNAAHGREVARTLEHFRIFLETTLGHVAQRTVLDGVPLDEAHARGILDQFVREA